MKLVDAIKQYFLVHKTPRYRDNRGWYASALTSNSRDLYWQATKVPETNPTDLHGYARMFVGKAIEEALVSQVFANLHFFGLHFYACEQIPIGGSAPNVNGYLDALYRERNADGTMSQPIVVEVKVKSGFGADFFKQSYDPGEAYMAQIGYYLRDLNSKKVTNEGRLLFVLVSDKSYGEMVEICVNYNAETDTVRAYEARHINGEVTPIQHTLQLQPLLDRLVEIEKAVAAKQLPEATHVYKQPRTPEFLETVSDNNLRKAIAGDKILGDWNISYSRYKAKHIEAEGTTTSYTPAELSLLQQEYSRRYPNSKKYGKAG